MPQVPVRSTRWPEGSRKSIVRQTSVVGAADGAAEGVGVTLTAVTQLVAIRHITAPSRVVARQWRPAMPTVTRRVYRRVVPAAGWAPGAGYRWLNTVNGAT